MRGKEFSVHSDADVDGLVQVMQQLREQLWSVAGVLESESAAGRNDDHRRRFAPLLQELDLLINRLHDCRMSIRKF